MAYKVIILYRLYMPSYFLGTFTEYPFLHPEKDSLSSLLSKHVYEFVNFGQPFYFTICVSGQFTKYNFSVARVKAV